MACSLTNFKERQFMTFLSGTNRVNSAPHYEVGPQSATLKLIVVIIRDAFTFNGGSSQGGLVFRLLYYSLMFPDFGTYISD
jgi:hypothetical protein